MFYAIMKTVLAEANRQLGYTGNSDEYKQALRQLIVALARVMRYN
jgi:hypothetical protein